MFSRQIIWPTFPNYKAFFHLPQVGIANIHVIILRNIDSLLGNDRETNNEGQWLLLGTVPRATMEVLLEAMFSVLSSSRLYDSTDLV
jgi:hypothetical protein